MQMILKAGESGESWEEIREWKEEPLRLKEEWLMREKKGVRVCGHFIWSSPHVVELLCACADSVFVADAVVVLFINLT